MEWTPDILRAFHLAGGVLTAIAGVAELVKKRRRAAIAAFAGAAVMALIGVTYEGGVRRPEIITAVATAATGVAALSASVFGRKRKHKE
ncbi:MAG: hypothetical protein K2Q06_03670 [Parvularculaceae bacterium]|nr:hypothetical protein [Parvularculaceae bacterium]